MADAAYYREYRRRIRDDPARKRRYAAVTAIRKARLRAVPGWRHEHEPDRRCPLVLPDIPPLHTGHPLFDEARQAVPWSGYLTTLRDPLVEDLRSEFVLARLEQRDPFKAVRVYRSQERSYGYRNRILLIEHRPAHYIED